MPTWITICLDGSLTAEAIREMADECEEVFEGHLLFFAVQEMNDNEE